MRHNKNFNHLGRQAGHRKALMSNMASSLILHKRIEIENYFDDDSIVLLDSMQDGVLYSNILLKLYLKSLKHGGRLQLDENIPYTCLLYTSRKPFSRGLSLPLAKCPSCSGSQTLKNALDSVTRFF